MKKLFLTCLNTFFGKELELKVRLFHVLAVTGVVICIIMTGASMAGKMWASMAINMGAGLASLCLLLYSARTRRYRLCYGLTIGVIFFILFPSLFFSGGGYRGGMPFFFVFAMVFTVYMLDGWAMPVVTGLELIFYSCLCVAAYRRPGLVVPFDSEAAVVTDILIGLSAVGISLGATMFVQAEMYRRQQRELEEAQQRAESASQAKSAFLANMSHEIRTPIHMILGMNEIIRRESRSTQVLEYSEKIEETGKMLLSLVDNVLDVSKIESGKTELISAPYGTGELVQTLSLIGWNNCKRKGLNFRTRIAEDLPPMLYGDMPHIRQIASNFLSNAAKYTETGEVVLEVAREPGDRAGELLLCISVRDTGIGIREEAMPTLFEAFNRVDLAQHRYIEGTGLGLTIVKGLTDLMGGTLSVTSNKDKGSNFTVKIPQKIVAEERDSGLEPRMTFLAPGVRILVVDDNEGNRMLMEKLLEPSQAEVDTARSGPECLDMVEETNYHLILMDYMMPGMDGLETMAHLRERSDFRTPVIALTADAAPETTRRLKLGGFTECLTKPVPWTELKRAVLACLPRELVTLMPEEQTAGVTHSGCDREVADFLEPYGVRPQEAMQYFENSMEKYLAVAELFLRHDEAERRKVESLWEQRDWAGLRFPIHALKGKAGNLGIARLAGLCAYIEKLCAEEQGEELDSIMPYLLYLWRRSHEGLGILLRSRKRDSACPGGAGEEELLGLLRQFRRKPSLDCLRSLMDGEHSEEGRDRLDRVKKLVEQIDFDRAAEEWTAYLDWKNGGDHT